MTEQDTDARIEQLELRLMHLEAAFEELTRASVDQQRRLAEQAGTIERLEKQLRSLNPSPLAAGEEEIPPHY